MGAMTFTQITSLVKRTVNNRTDLSVEISQAVNNAYLQTSLLRGVAFRELDGGPTSFSTVDGTALYSFSTILSAARDIMAIFSIRDTTNNRRLKPTSPQDIDDKSTAEGKPYWFAHYGTGVLLNPTPDAVYSLAMRYRVRPTLLSGALQATVLPEEFDWPIVWGAASDINAVIGVLDKSSFYATKRREALELVGITAEVEDEYSDFALAPDLS